MGNTHYTTTCPNGHGVTWSGYSRSEWKYQSSTECSECVSERNARQRAEREARERAEKARRDEEARVRRIKEEAEKKERERQRQIERKRQEEQRIERETLLRQREQAENKRKREAELLRKAKELEEMKKMAEKLKAKKKENALEYYSKKKINTLEAVIALRKRVNETAVAGKIVTERTEAISKDLKESLGGDYEVVKSEIDRYKGYGKEMTGITNLFVKEFEKVFTPITVDFIVKMAKKHNAATKLGDCEASRKQKEMLQNHLKKKMGAIDKAIDSVEARLELMTQYYERMSNDLKFFEEFRKNKHNELQQIVSKLENFATVLQNDADRSVLQGLKDDDGKDVAPQVLDFEEKYEWTTTEVTEGNVVESTVAGGVIGGVFGGIVGGVVAGPLGLISGAILGATAGAVVGYALSKKPETHTTTHHDKVKVTSKLMTYSAQKQADAFREIAKNIKNSESYKKMEEELKKVSIEQQLQQCDWLKDSIKGPKDTVKACRAKVTILRRRLESTENFDVEEAKNIGDELENLSNEIEEMLTMMKENKGK